jgi:O-antigen/teichoic acid export membrane protein
MNTFVQSALNKVLNTENKRHIAQNSGWLMLDYGARMLVGLFIGIWVTRYLGPADYGKLNYAVALISIFAPLSLLGLDTTVPKELIIREQHKEETLGSAFFLKLTGGFLIFILALAIAFTLHPDDKVILILACFIGLSYVFKSFEAIDIWFLNKLSSKYTVIARNSGLFVSGILRVIFILGGFSVIYFGLVVTVEAFIIAVVSLVIFVKTEFLSVEFRKIRFVLKEMLNLLKKSWIFALIGFLNLALMNIDKIMIENMLDSYELGLYSVATSVCVSFSLLGSSMIKSVYPVLIKFKEERPFEEYAADFQKLFNYLALLAYGIILCVLVSANVVVPLLWGKTFAFSALILCVQVFSILFLFVGCCGWYHMFAMNLSRFFVFAFTAGIFSNIALNYVLIRQIGVIGAAYSTVISFFIVYVLSGLFYDETRQIFKMQLKAVLLVDLIRGILNNKRLPETD